MHQSLLSRHDVGIGIDDSGMGLNAGEHPMHENKHPLFKFSMFFIRTAPGHLQTFCDDGWDAPVSTSINHRKSEVFTKASQSLGCDPEIVVWGHDLPPRPVPEGNRNFPFCDFRF